MKVSKSLKMMLKSILSLKLSEVVTDKGTLIYDGEEALKVGDEVFMQSEDSDEPIPAADGDYETDTQIIKIESGVVVSIEDKEQSEEKSEEKSEEQQMAEEQSEEQKPADEAEQTEEPKVEERIAALEAKNEEIVAALTKMLNAVESIEGKIEELNARLAKVETEPAADPVDEKSVEETEHKSRLSYLKK